MRATEFLQILWGERAPAVIVLWTKHNKKSHHLRSALGANMIALEGSPDVYTGVALTHKDHGARSRAGNNDARVLAGLWLDLDVNGGPDNKQGAAPSKAAALELARLLHEPTVLVDSGYGIHAWWLLDEPWWFKDFPDRDLATQASAQWYALHRQQAQRRGWTIDHTHDLARLLRVPGTTNAKGGGAAPVDVISASGPRYTRDQLLQLASAAGPIDIPTAANGRRVAITARTDAQPPNGKLEALRFNSPEFADALDHRGHENWSQSEWDLSLASLAANAGWTPQEIADLVTWDRTRHGKGDKAQRIKYVTRTVEIATARATRDEAAASLEQLARVAA